MSASINALPSRSDARSGCFAIAVSWARANTAALGLDWLITLAKSFCCGWRLVSER